MRCFSHEGEEAVGICKSCGRGICAACAVDLGKGLACRARCEEDVRRLIEVIDSSVRTNTASLEFMASGRRSAMIWAGMHAVLGTVFVGWGISAPGRLFPIVLMGVLFLLVGVVQFVRTNRLPPVEDETDGS